MMMMMMMMIMIMMMMGDKGQAQAPERTGTGMAREGMVALTRVQGLISGQANVGGYDEQLQTVDKASDARARQAWRTDQLVFMVLVAQQWSVQGGARLVVWLHRLAWPRADGWLWSDLQSPRSHNPCPFGAVMVSIFRPCRREKGRPNVMSWMAFILLSAVAFGRQARAANAAASPKQTILIGRRVAHTMEDHTAAEVNKYPNATGCQLKLPQLSGQAPGGHS
ncbi:uncharacterized protein IWZ02DRAFT_60423 [Phyllosticta citriasiana]|uniref:uncharacterized protein n=1 Tax=Phyllosticta citriasiana TaxID=595635 RepID=UPI0030FD8229